LINILALWFDVDEDWEEEVGGAGRLRISRTGRKNKTPSGGSKFLIVSSYDRLPSRKIESQGIKEHALSLSLIEKPLPKWVYSNYSKPRI
jgi:hypothetical protein